MTGGRAAEAPGPWGGGGPGPPDKYASMMALADLFDATGAELRDRARLAAGILADDDLEASGELSPGTFAQVVADLRAATTGRAGLQSRAVELDADALVVRATVLTYQWIDELQATAYQTLGSIAGRAIGHLAPEVSLGGSLAGTDPARSEVRDGIDVAAALSEVARSDPGLVERVTNGSGGLVESLALRSLLTLGAGVPEPAARLGLEELGVAAMPASAAGALRDLAGALAPPSADLPAVESRADGPEGLADLLTELGASVTSVRVDRVAPGRYVVYLPGPHVGMSGLRLVSDESGSYAERAAAAISAAVSGDDDARVLLVGRAQGGVAAARVAAEPGHQGFTVDTVLTSGAPGAHAPRLPAAVRMLALEERTDPVALLGAVLNAGDDRRLTIVFDGAGVPPGEDAYLHGARLADRAAHPALRAELARLRDAGFLTG